MKDARGRSGCKHSFQDVSMEMVCLLGRERKMIQVKLYVQPRVFTGQYACKELLRYVAAGSKEPSESCVASTHLRHGSQSTRMVLVVVYVNPCRV
jgi:hypothetical protein